MTDSDAAELRIDRERALQLLTLARDLPAAPRPRPGFAEIRRAAREIAERWAEASTAQMLAADRVDATTPQGRLLRWLNGLARRCPQAELNELGPEIDRWAAAFGRRQPKGLELALESLLDALPDPPGPSGLSALREFLAAHSEWRIDEDERVRARYAVRELCAVDVSAPGDTR